MSILTDIENDFTKVETFLKDVGASSVASLGAGVDTALANLKNLTGNSVANAEASVVTEVENAAKALFPQLAPLFNLVNLVQNLPTLKNFKPADWNDPVFLNRSEDPYENDPKNSSQDN